MATQGRVSKHFRVGELFSGAGGMALGSQSAYASGVSFRHVWANDVDLDACATFAQNIHIDPSCVVCKNVEDVRFDDLSAIDGLAFGFPCNDFSVVGKRNGLQGQYGPLYTWGEKALTHFQPLFFVAENVGGLLSSGDTGDFALILSKFRETGYVIFPSLYRLENYGVPQARHRIILVGFRIDLEIVEFEHPLPTHIESPVTSRAALSDIPVDAHNNELTKHPPHVIERLRHIKPGENAFTASLPEDLQLNLRSGATISQIYRRLLPNKPSYTVTGSGGGGTHLYHWDEPRALTNRERARLQTFPDDFHFRGGKESVRRQIGMAFPPLGARIIFERVLQTLADKGITP